jgi:hypothetical protein
MDVERLKPFLASCVYFDRQRYWLGLPRIERGWITWTGVALGVDLSEPTALTDLERRLQPPGQPAGMLLERDAGGTDCGHSDLISVGLQSGMGFASGQGTHVIHSVCPDRSHGRPTAERPASTGRTSKLQ